jgi:hypothetical protein
MPHCITLTPPPSQILGALTAITGQYIPTELPLSTNFFVNLSPCGFPATAPAAEKTEQKQQFVMKM